MFGVHGRLKKIMKLKLEEREIALRELAQELGCSLASSYTVYGKHLEEDIVHRIFEADRSRRESRMWWVTLFSVATSFLISICLVSVAFRQLSLAREQATEAKQANERAQAALKDIEKARADVLHISKSVLAVAEILPRTGGFGGGLLPADEAKIKKNSEYLKGKIKELETLPR